MLPKQLEHVIKDHLAMYTIFCKYKIILFLSGIKPNKSKNHTDISFITQFCRKSIVFWDFKIKNSVRIIEGSDNGDSDNRGSTVYINIYIYIYTYNIAQASSYFKCLDECHTTPTLISKALHLVTYVQLFKMTATVTVMVYTALDYSYQVGSCNTFQSKGHAY